MKAQQIERPGLVCIACFGKTPPEERGSIHISEKRYGIYTCSICRTPIVLQEWFDPALRVHYENRKILASVREAQEKTRDNPIQCD